MGDILLIFTLLITVKTLLMTGLVPDRRYAAVFSIVCMAFVGIMHPWALEQNKRVLEAWLEGRDILTDLSLVIMIDLLLTIGFCISVLDRMTGDVKGRFRRALAYVPSLLMFPTLYYVQINLFFMFVGRDFLTITIVYAVVVGVVVFGGTWLLRRAMPSASTRLELTALVELLIFLLIVCCTVFHPEALMYSYSSSVDFGALGAVVLLVAALAVIGFYRKEIIRIFKRKNKISK